MSAMHADGAWLAGPNQKTNQTEILPAIAGLEPCSLIDYPKHLAAVVFLGGCNLDCSYCHNRSLIDGQSAAVMTSASLSSFLAQRRGFLDAVVVTGGEPTIHPGLPALLRLIREKGYRIKLDTNGTRPQQLQQILGEGLVDYVAMDVKSPTNNPALYAQITGIHDSDGLAQRLCTAIRQSMSLLQGQAVEYEFRTTVCSELGPADIQAIAAEIGESARYALQPCRSQGRLSHHETSRVAALHSLIGRRQGETVARI